MKTKKELRAEIVALMKERAENTATSKAVRWHQIDKLICKLQKQVDKMK